MSEVIVRMEFRKNCLDCDLRQIVYGDSYADTDVYCSKENRFVGKRFGSTKDLARPDWCPIVCKLPEQHGDLISREYAIATAVSGLTMELPPSEGGGTWVRVTEVRESIKSAPTIVPATERRTDDLH